MEIIVLFLFGRVSLGSGLSLQKTELPRMLLAVVSCASAILVLSSASSSSCWAFLVL